VNLVPPNTTMTTSIPITPAWNYDWVTYITSKFGKSQGRRIYTLDNEPGLWTITHRDAHPLPVTYGNIKREKNSYSKDEIWVKMVTNAMEISDADPTAEIAGPSEWGWTNCNFHSHFFLIFRFLLQCG
jgi:hypothetical protein